MLRVSRVGFGGRPNYCRDQFKNMTAMTATSHQELLIDQTPEVLAKPASEDLPRPTGPERSIARLRLLWEKRRYLLRCAAIGLVGAGLLAFLIPKQYDSTTRLMPPDSQSTSSVAMMATLAEHASGLAALSSDLLGLKESGATFVGILRSRAILDRLVQRFNLKKLYRCRLAVDARERLAENTQISEDRKSGIISIAVTDRDPQRAASLAGAYVEELNQLVVDLNTSAAHRERVFLEERLRTVRQDLASAEGDFSQFASKTGAIDIKEQGRAMVEVAATLQGQLIAAQSQLEGLKQIYTDNNVRVRSVQARITALRSQLQKLGGKSGGAAPSGDEPASDSSYPTLRQLPILGVPYADKFRQLKVEEAVFETLTKEFELAKVQEAKETPTVKVLEAPEVPEKKSFPPRLLIMFLGTFCATIVGVAWVLGTAGWQEIDPQDPRKLFAQEVSGTLKARLRWAVPNGSGSSAAKEGLPNGPGTDNGGQAPES